ncbi:MAG: D-glycero-beta-D-manno-heptose-7-phosphate kinase [Saprospiraceae bacterium]|nr:D-glycero-beta-D-manno-heptose-7-phosphate kinase [Candidatus Opimibacter skivensis]
MISSQDIEKVQQKARQIKALVIGDAMLDQYIYGTVDRISPEAPVPVLSHQRTEIKAGGSANVALNLAAWGCKTTLIGLTGNDPNANKLASLLEEKHIRHHFVRSESRPTTIKTRVVASSHHLLRIDEESVEYLSGTEESLAIDHLLNFIRQETPNLIVLEDYNKGFLSEKIISAVIGIAHELGVFTAVDPKDKNFFRYAGVDLFKPNLREAGQAAHRHLKIEDLDILCKDWRKTMKINTIAVTLGGQGMYLQDEKSGNHMLPERSIDVVDVCGAGDAVICALALGMMSGLDLEQCGSLANLTGAYVCSHSGVVALDVAAIHDWL